VHRDIKPSNCVFGPGATSSLGSSGARSGSGSATSGSKRQLYVLDFGQARLYRDEAGGVRPARDSAEFRGTSLYSSLHAHQLKDLGRRDDVWSVMYCVIDMARGGLPWRAAKDDRSTCEGLKAYYAEHPDELVAGLPGAAHLLAALQHLLCECAVRRHGLAGCGSRDLLPLPLLPSAHSLRLPATIRAPHPRLPSLPAALSFENKPNYALLAAQLRAALADAVDAGGAHLQRVWPWYALTPGVQECLATLSGGGIAADAAASLADAAVAKAAVAPPGAEPELPSAPAAATLALYRLPQHAQVRAMAVNLGAAVFTPPAALGSPPSPAQRAEAADLVASLDFTRTRMSCDAVLESRARLAVVPPGAAAPGAFPLPGNLAATALALAPALKTHLQPASASSSGSSGSAHVLLVQPATTGGAWPSVELAARRGPGNERLAFPSYRALYPDQHTCAPSADADAVMTGFADELEAAASIVDDAIATGVLSVADLLPGSAGSSGSGTSSTAATPTARSLSSFRASAAAAAAPLPLYLPGYGAPEDDAPATVTGAAGSEFDGAASVAVADIVAADNDVSGAAFRAGSKRPRPADDGSGGAASPTAYAALQRLRLRPPHDHSYAGRSERHVLADVRARLDVLPRLLRTLLAQHLPTGTATAAAAAVSDAPSSSSSSAATGAGPSKAELARAARLAAWNYALFWRSIAAAVTDAAGCSVGRYTTAGEVPPEVQAVMGRLLRAAGGRDPGASYAGVEPAALAGVRRSLQGLATAGGAAHGAPFRAGPGDAADGVRLAYAAVAEWVAACAGKPAPMATLSSMGGAAAGATTAGVGAGSDGEGADGSDDSDGGVSGDDGAAATGVSRRTALAAVARIFVIRGTVAALERERATMAPIPAPPGWAPRTPPAMSSLGSAGGGSASASRAAAAAASAPSSAAASAAGFAPAPGASAAAGKKSRWGGVAADAPPLPADAPPLPPPLPPLPPSDASAPLPPPLPLEEGEEPEYPALPPPLPAAPSASSAAAAALASPPEEGETTGFGAPPPLPPPPPPAAVPDASAPLPDGGVAEVTMEDL
jgi:serine/threonine protein kinase